MSALTEDRNTPVRDGVMFAAPVAAAVTVHAGAMMVLNATGYAQPATTATGLVILGRAEEAIDNADGADGDETVTVRRGVFRWENSAGADELTRAQIGDSCYIVDDQTVAKTDATGTRSVAGVVVDLDDDGVWVRMGV